MDPTLPPPPYSSEPQSFQPSRGQFNMAPPPVVQMPQGWPPPYQQQQQRFPPDNQCLSCLFRCSYCFDGSRSRGIRYATIVFGALLLVHGIIRVSIAGAAIPEANAILKKDPAYTLDPVTRPNYPLVEFYSRYINILFLSESQAGALGVVFGAMLPAFLLEIFPGACLIAAGVLLKITLCGIPIVFLIAGIVETVFDCGAVMGQVGGIGGGRCELSDCERGTIIVAFIIRAIVITFFQFCISLDVTLWQQIRLGLYVMNREPPAPPAEPVPTVGPVDEPRIIGEQTDPTTDASSSG